MTAYHIGVDAARHIAQARKRARLTLRELAARAGTSHSALAAYEAGRVTPGVDTLERIVRAAGQRLQIRLAPELDLERRGEELREVLELADMFPSRPAARLAYPPSSGR